MELSKAYTNGSLVKQEKTRDELRSLSDTNFFFFCKAILGFKDMTSQLHLDLCNFMQHRSSHKKLVLVPRGHLKTHVVTIGYTLWRVCKDPNLRVIWVNATATNAQHFLRIAAKQFETNSLLRWLYPEVIPDFKKVKWCATEIELSRDKVCAESTIEVIGISGAVTSRHYDIVIKDDIMDESIASSEVLMEDVSRWLRYGEAIYEDPSMGEDIVVGTRYSNMDIYKSMKDSGEYSVYERQAIENGVSIWPERFSLETLSGIKKNQGSYVFSSQYMNNPVDPESALFKRFNIVSPDKIPKRGVVFMTVDPATGKGQDDLAIVVSKFDQFGVEYVIDSVVGKYDPRDTATHLIRLWRLYNPVNIRIEDVAFQNVLIFYIKELCLRMGLGLPIIPLKRRGESKVKRILRLQPRFENDEIFFVSTLSNIEIIRNQVLTYSGAVIERDDFLDALSDMEENVALVPRLKQDDLVSAEITELQNSGLDASSISYWTRVINARNVSQHWVEEFVA